MIFSKVGIEMHDGDYQYAIISRDDYSVLVLCNKLTNVCTVFGGKKLNIIKSVNVSETSSGMYDVFMRKIGKMCKKYNDIHGHYFSDEDGFVSGEVIETYIKSNDWDKVKQICKEIKL